MKELNHCQFGTKFAKEGLHPVLRLLGAGESQPCVHNCVQDFVNSQKLAENVGFLGASVLALSLWGFLVHLCLLFLLVWTDGPLNGCQVTSPKCTQQVVDCTVFSFLFGASHMAASKFCDVMPVLWGPLA
eukprot:1156711-Pelagomonas_calceolata.AAC.4